MAEGLGLRARGAYRNIALGGASKPQRMFADRVALRVLQTCFRVFVFDIDALNP